MRCDSKTGEHERRRVGGDVALQEIVYEQYMLPENLDSGVERVCVTINVKGQKPSVCVVNQLPQIQYTCLSVLPLLHYLFVDLADKVNTVICLGDNIDVMSKSSNDAKYLRQLLQYNKVSQLIKKSLQG